MELLQQHLPQGYQLHPCHDHHGHVCGCMMPLKTKPTSPCQCKVHGRFKDSGGAEALQVLREAGYRGLVCTQWPLHSETQKLQGRVMASVHRGKKRSRRGGQYREGCNLKLDLVLSSPGPECTLVAVEVQGNNHTRSRVVKSDHEKRIACLGACITVYGLSADECICAVQQGPSRSASGFVSAVDSIAVEIVSMLALCTTSM